MAVRRRRYCRNRRSGRYCEYMLGGAGLEVERRVGAQAPDDMSEMAAARSAAWRV